MERQVIFLRSLFILLVASYVAYACMCSRRSLEYSLCPANNKTVLMATVKTNATYLDAYGNVTTDPNPIGARYEMYLNQSFTNWTIPLDTDNEGFFMYFPQSDSQCGRKFNKSDSFLLSGMVDHNGNFRSSSCEVVMTHADVFSNSTVMDILNGNHTRHCRSF